MTNNQFANYFALFGLDQAFNIDLTALAQQFRKIQSAMHPDRFVSATATEKLKSMQLATLANEAYQTLKNPATRAKYILSLQGIDATQETNTTMPADFLMQQMEWREFLEDAKADKDIPALENLMDTMQLEAQSLADDLNVLFDQQHDNVTATDTTRKLIFIDKVCADINKAIILLED